MNKDKNILLAETAQKYHSSYAADIAYKIGICTHLSVLVPSLMGCFPIIPNVYDMLEYRDRLYVIVNSQEDIEYINTILFDVGRDEERIYPILFEDYIKEQPDGECYIIYELPKEKRIKLANILVSQVDKIVISVGKLGDNDKLTNKGAFTTIQAYKMINELNKFTLEDSKPHSMVFEVDSILDIREISYATSEEKEKLIKNLYDICDEYEKDFKFVSDSLDKNDKIILQQKFIEELELQIKFLKMIATSAGININELEKCLEDIKRLKREYLIRFENITDEQHIELLETEFQNVIAELCVKATRGVFTDNDKEHYELLIKNELSESVWDKLTENSKMYLISAMMTFDSLSKLDNKENIDYSGVCLQVTKVLDEEMALRLFKEYMQYLKEKPLNKWPAIMKNKSGNSPLPDYIFTIGTIAKVIGYNVKNKTIDDTIAFDNMVQYAKEKLYNDDIDIDSVKNKLISIARCAEKTRNDYRNPAAHRNTMSYVSAKECIEYLIQQYKMLKEILKDMRF